MPITLTVEVPDELVDKLDALAAHHDETREAFATQSVEFCIREGTRVLEDETLTPEEAELLDQAEERISAGQYVTQEEVERELDDRLRREGDQGPREAAE